MGDAFQVAGEAACMLEDMGFVAVARKREGRITVELWRMIDGVQRSLRVDVDEPPFGGAALLAETCAAKFRATLLRHQT